MSIFNNLEENYWRNLITKTILVIFTVAIIVWFLPRNEGRQFRYDVGKPWMYGSVIATFDFPIYKTDEAIKHEQDSLLRQFQPYYTVNSNVGNEQIKRFLHDFSQGIPGLPKEYVELIANQLKQVYQTGIVSTPEYNRIYKDSTSMIRIISGKNAKSFPIGNFYSTIAAYEHIFFDEKISAQRQILSRCNLNDYVEPNLIYDKERSEAERTDLLSSIPLASGMVMSGQKIIDRGEVINDYTYRVLTSFDKETKRRSSTEDELTTTIIGQALFVLILVMMFTFYLTLFLQRLLRQTTQHHHALCDDYAVPNLCVTHHEAQFLQRIYHPICHGTYLCARLYGFTNGFHHACHDDSHLCGSCEIPI